jgi:3',5'-cyclic AMP phosphodiesterase CpdA
MSPSRATPARCHVPGPCRPRRALATALIALAAAAPALPAQARAVERAWDRPSPDPDRIILTWAGNPATTQSVTWRTDTTVTQAVAQVAIATDGPKLADGARTDTATTERLDATTVPTPGGRVAHFHSVTFTGLRPDTLYAYRVGDGTRWSEWFQFRTASATGRKPFSFLYVGDVQNEILSLWSRVVREGFRRAPEMRFIVHAGDLVDDANSDRQWGEWFRAGGFIHAMVPGVPAAGNHEYRARSAAEAAARQSGLSVFWQPQFTLPRNGVAGLEETNYWFDYENTRIVVLNSNREQAAQAAWLREVLRDNPQPWTIATFHHPVFSAARERDNAALREAWRPVLEAFGVDLVLQGHDHTYARGRSVAAGPSVRNVPTGVNTRSAAGGPVYVVSVSGAKMYQATPDGWDRFGARIDRTAENTQLFQVIRIAGDTLTYEARTATGALYDAFDLVREPAGNRFVDRQPAAVPVRTMTSPPSGTRR